MGLADPTHTPQRLHRHHVSGGEASPNLVQLVGPADEVRITRRDVPPPPPSSNLRVSGGQIAQRLKQRLAEPLRSGHRGKSQATGGQSRPKHRLSRAVLQIYEQIRRTLGLLAHEKHQPRQTRLTSNLELQLGVGQLRSISNRRAVPKPHYRYIHVDADNSLPAHLPWLLIPRTEIRHVADRIPGPGHGPLRRCHKRPPGWKPSQLRSVAQKHPPRP
jgi:hypothetical protein